MTSLRPPAVTPPGGAARQVAPVRAVIGGIRVGALLALGLAAGLTGCAKKPTTVLADVSVDPAVPALLQLRISVARAADPSMVASNSYSSLFKGDAADRPAPFSFPLKLSMNLPAEFAGDVIVTVAGLDWDTNAVVARGSGTAEVVAEKTAMTTLTLTPVVGTNPDGGGDGGDGGDGEPGDGDAGGDTGPDAGVDTDAGSLDAPVEAGPDATGDTANDGADAVAVDDGFLDIAPDGGVPDADDEAGSDAADDAAPDDATAD